MGPGVFSWKSKLWALKRWELKHWVFNFGEAMRRRDLIQAIAGSTIGWPLAARAQIAKVRQIGLLSPFTRSDAAPWNQAFLKGLRDLGWINRKKHRLRVPLFGGK